MSLPPPSDCGARPRRPATVNRVRVALNPLVGAICGEVGRRELAAVVCAQHLELAAALLCGCLMALDGVCSCRLGIEQHGPHVAGGIVDE